LCAVIDRAYSRLLWLIHIDPDNFMRVLLSAIASRGAVQWILALAAKVVAPQVWDQQSVLRTRPARMLQRID